MNPDYCFYLPVPPTGSEWSAVLKWMVAVMDDDDTSLSFVASILSHNLKNDGLSEKQAAGATKIYRRVSDEFANGRLKIQGWVKVPSEKSKLRLVKTVAA